MNSHETAECEATGNTQQKSGPQALPDTTRRKIPGIYGLRCRTTGKWYIGQTTQHIPTRWGDYKNLKCKRQPKIYNAILKYGFDDFDKIVLEECNDKLLIDSREKYWIRHYNSFVDGYNLTEGGKPNVGLFHKGRTFSEEHLKKLSEAQRGRKHSTETLARMSNTAKARWRNPEERLKMSKLKMGKTHTQETRQRLSGKNNPQYGAHWYTNGFESKSIKGDSPPIGWWKGRAPKKSPNNLSPQPTGLTRR